MAIRVQCPACGKRLQARDSAVGKRAKCPHCSKLLVIPKPVLEAEEAAEETPVQPPPAPAPARDLSDLLDEADEYPLAAPTPTPTPTAAPTPGPPDTRRPCPMCGEMIPLGAGMCRFCGEIFDPALKKKKRRRAGAGAEDEDLSTVDYLLAILCSGIGCICGIVYLIQGKPKAGKMIGLSLLFAFIWNVVRFLIELAAGGAP